MSLLLSTGAFASSLSGTTAGMVLMKPTSITHSGTSATLGANGQVTFSAVTALSLNGCFTADFDNYALVAYATAGSATNVSTRLRASGTDDSGTNYNRQYLEADNTSVGAGRSTGAQSFLTFTCNNVTRAAVTVHLYGPYLAQPTAFRSINIRDANGAVFQDWAHTHDLSTSYDGISLVTGVAITGSVAIYGIRS